MDNNKQFLYELDLILNSVLSWATSFQNGIKDYDFDIDNKLFFLSEKYKINFSEEPLSFIYNLLDFYCDCVKHEFSQIDEDYPISVAQNDIKLISSNIHQNDFIKIDLEGEITSRLKSI